jgi:hypothetical protein
MVGPVALTLQLAGGEMATIVIRDLPENLDLDRKARQAITGGARFRPAGGAPGAPQPWRGQRIVDLGAGAARNDAGTQQAASNKPDR